MGKNSCPQGQIDDLEPTTVQEIVSSLKQLHDRGKPTTDEEIKQRIDEYFSFCQQSSIRPGIESLCMALHISRTTLFNWNNGTNCSEKCQEYVQSAKAFIGAFIEQAMLGGKISPPSGIFLMKNWLSYKDAISIEESIPNKEEKRVLTVDELPRLGEFAELQSKNLPQLGIKREHEEGNHDI